MRGRLSSLNPFKGSFLNHLVLWILTSGARYRKVVHLSDTTCFATKPFCSYPNPRKESFSVIWIESLSMNNLLMRDCFSVLETLALSLAKLPHHTGILQLVWHRTYHIELLKWVNLVSSLKLAHQILMLYWTILVAQPARVGGLNGLINQIFLKKPKRL